jgi:hypothetical protein
MNREQIAADWAAGGFSCDLWTDATGQRWEDFVHDTDELVKRDTDDDECRSLGW